MNLNGQTSYGIADALGRRGIPFVFSTGYSDKRIEARFDGRPVLEKPYNEKELAAVLAGLLPATPKVSA